MGQRTFTAEFKLKIAIELLKGEKTFSEICAQYELHPTQAKQWRKKLMQEGATVFTKHNGNLIKEKDELIEQLYKRLGQRDVELDWLKKKMETING